MPSLSAKKSSEHRSVTHERPPVATLIRAVDEQDDDLLSFRYVSQSDTLDHSHGDAEDCLLIAFEADEAVGEDVVLGFDLLVPTIDVYDSELDHTVSFRVEGKLDRLADLALIVSINYSGVTPIALGRSGGRQSTSPARPCQPQRALARQLEGHPVTKAMITMNCTIRSLAAASGALALAALAACGGGAPAKPAGPPTAASLAAKLGCHVAYPDSDPISSYDIVQYVDATGGSCSDGTAADVSITIITFPSQTKETDWLHQNEIAESASPAGGNGYFELAVGHLWAIASDSGGASSGISYIISTLGGKDSTF